MPRCWSSSRPPRHQDSAWSWVVVMSASVSLLIILGIINCFAVIMPVLLGHFHETRQKIAWIGSIAQGLTFFASPLAGIFIEKSSFRIAAVIGTGACATGLLLTSITQSPLQIFFTYSILYGFGSCFVFTSSVYAVTNYFQKRRYLALGFIGAGVNVGVLCLGPLLQVLLDTFGWRVMYRIMAGMVGIAFILVMSFDPNVLENAQQQVGGESYPQPITIRHEQQTGGEAYPWQPVGEESREHPPHDGCRQHVCGEFNKHMDISVIQTDGESKSQQQVGEEINKVLHSDVNTVQTDGEVNPRQPGVYCAQQICEETREHPPSCGCRQKVGEEFNKDLDISEETREHPTCDGCGHLDVRTAQTDGESNPRHPTDGCGQQVIGELSKDLHSDVTVIQTDGEYNPWKAVVCYAQSIREEPNGQLALQIGYQQVGSELSEGLGISEERQQEDSLSECSMFTETIRTPAYAIALVTVTMEALTAFVSYVHLVKYAEEVGIPAQQASNLFIYVGIASLVSSAPTGLILDIPAVNPFHVNQAGAVTMATSMLLLQLATQYEHFVAFAVFWGLGLGIFCVTILVLLLTTVKPRLQIVSYPLGQMCSSMGNISGSPLIGFIADVYGSYKSAYYTAGSIMLLAACIPFLQYCIKPWRTKPLHYTTDNISAQNDQRHGSLPLDNNEGLESVSLDDRPPYANVAFQYEPGIEDNCIVTKL